MLRIPGFASLVLAFGVGSVGAQQIPHAQDRPPGPALSPKEAMAKMELRPGFRVELFAAEPDVVNPIAMTFDDRGRVWITESVEYPRTEAGAGKDRVKIIEDTDGDGKADRATIFAEGLNIPSGIAIGSDGVYVANAPDLLFLKDTDGDDRADSKEVLLSGFGRTDTHELPNCLTWGPDGWLYGWNGVFNYSKVVHQGKTFDFTCALWRYHPRSKKFELFAEGTSNPWGLDYDENGSFFASACVIDHLWHLTETGYYHRQAGPYPPFTWKIESIVKHKHQKAAYCGLCWFDSPAYPAEYRKTLFMGNLHGSCINNDGLERDGASYKGTSRPDFLSANDAWFMPVVQKVGPDGCLWIVDWYDRYHCYQDARRDPNGLDRLKGRIYRIVHVNSKPSAPIDLAKLTDAELLDGLDDPNVYIRRSCRRLLVERRADPKAIQSLVLDESASRTQRTEGLWTLVSRGPLDADFHLALLGHSDPLFRAWAVRAAGNDPEAEVRVRDKVLSLAADLHPDVRVQVAIAAGKLGSDRAVEVLLGLLGVNDPSELLPRIQWRNLEPLVAAQTDRVVEILTKTDAKGPMPFPILERIVDRVRAAHGAGDARFVKLVGLVLSLDDPQLFVTTLMPVLSAILNGEIPAEQRAALKEQLGAKLMAPAQAEPGDPRRPLGLCFALLFGADATEPASKFLQDADQSANNRSLVLQALMTREPARTTPIAVSLLSESGSRDELRQSALSALARTESPDTAKQLLAAYGSLRPGLRPQVLDVLTGRKAWAEMLLAAVEAKAVPAADVNGNQLRKVIGFGDAILSDRVKKTWGVVRMERSPNREELIRRFARVADSGRGDTQRGEKVFDRVCAQCHKMGEKGSAVGPDLAGVGRSSREQLLSNLLDPNLVIGKDYQARTIATTDGRVVTGLVAEDSPQRVVLKVAGGKLEVFPRSEIEVFRDSTVSLMPEDLEKQVNDQEFRDLLAYLLSVH